MSDCYTPRYTPDEAVLIALRSGEITVDAEGRVWKHYRKQADGSISPYPQPQRIDSEDRNGYWLVKLRRYGKVYNSSAHRVQWINAHGVIPSDLEVNHKDRTKSNNSLDNLELLTHAENLKHARTRGNWSTRGADRWNAKLTWEKVDYARNQVQRLNRTRVDVARELGVSATVVSLIVSGKSWVRQ